MSDNEVLAPQADFDAWLPKKPANPVLASMEEEERQAVDRNLLAAQKVSPDEHAAALRVATLHGIDVNAARAALRGGLAAKQDAADTQARASSDPAFRAWLTDPDNAALASDAMAETRRLSATMGKTAPPQPGLVEDVLNGGAMGIGQLHRMLIWGQAWAGMDTPEETEAKLRKNAGVVEMLGRARSQATQEELAEIEGAEGFFPSVGAYLTNPRGFLATVSQTFVSSSPTMFLGGLAGAGVGRLALGPATGAASEAVAMKIASGLGAGGAELLTEKMGWTDEALRGRGYDPAVPGNVSKALRDKSLMAEVQAEASNKAWGTTSIDFLSLMLAGRWVSGAKGVLRKAGAGAAELVAIQAPLAAASEVVGQQAARGRIDWDDVAAETMGEFGPGTTEIVMGTLFHKAQQGSERARAAVQTAQEAAQALIAAENLNAAKDAYLATKVSGRAPERTWKLMEAAGGIKYVRIPREAWDSHWKAQNKSPATEAAKVFFGGDEAYHASATSREVVFPVGPYMDALGETADWDALLPEAILSDDGSMSAKDAETEFAAREEAIDRVAAGVTLFQSEQKKLLDEQAEIERQIATEEAKVALPEPRARTPQEMVDLREAQIVTARKMAADDPANAAAAEAEIAEHRKEIEVLVAQGAVARPEGQELAAEQQAGDGPRATPEQALALSALRDRLTEVRGKLSTLAARQDDDRRYEAVAIEKAVADLVAAGRKKREAQANAAILGALWRTLAARTGLPIQQIVERFPLAFEQGAAPTDMQQGEKGGLRLPSPDSPLYTLAFYAKADRSTFFHEIGHYALDVLGQLAESAPGLAADFQETLKYLRVNVRADIGRAQHETFARTFEAYLFEGKAPSNVLRRVMGTIRDWLVKLYGSLKALDVPINPEIRGVMDRLLATDEEIAQARYEAGTDLALPDEVVAQMEPDARAAYQEALNAAQDHEREEAGKSILADLTKERLAAFRARVNEVAPKIKKEIEQSASGRALAAIRAGKAPKIDREAAQKAYSKPLFEALEKAGLLGKNGVPPDAAAALLNQRTDEFAAGLLAANNAEAVARAQASQLVAAESPDLATDAQARRDRRRATLSEARAKVLSIEAAALAAQLVMEDADRRAARDDVRKLEDIREEVERDLLRTPPNQIDPRRELAAARRASKQATQHALSKEYRKALEAKNAERVSFERARIGTNIKEAARKHTKYVADMNGETRQKRLTKAGLTCRDRLNDVLFHFGMRDKGSESKDPRGDMDKWVAERKGGDDGRAPFFTGAILAGDRRYFESLPLPQMEYVRKVVQSIWEMAKAEEEFLVGQHKRTMDELAGAARASATAYAQRTKRPYVKPSRLSKTKQEKAAQRWKNLAKGWVKVPEIARQLDDEEDGGPWWSVFVNPFNHGFDWKRKTETEINGRLAKAKQRYFTEAELADMDTKHDMPGVAEKVSHADRLAVLRNIGNEGNRARLIIHTDEKGKRLGGNFTEAEVQTILSHTTEADLAYVEAEAAEFEALWPLIQALEESVVGVTPERVETSPYTFTRTDGTVVTTKGWYYPIVYGDIRSEEMTEAQKAEELGRAITGRAMTRHGHTEARVKEYWGSLRLDADVTHQALSQVVHDLAFRRAVIDANRFLAHKTVDEVGNSTQDIKDVLIGYFGEESYAQIKSMLSDIASNDTRFFEQSDWIAARIRRGISAAVLGGKLSTTLINTTGFTQSVNRVGGRDGNRDGAKWMLRASQELVADRALIDFALANSGVLPGRASNLTREVAEQARLSKDNQRGKIEAFNWYLYGRTQIFVDVITWYAAYLKASEKHPDDEQRAFDVADSVVREAQGTGDLIDLSAFQRGTEWKKWATMFYHYASTTLARTNASWRQLQVKDPETYARFLADTAMLFLLPAAISYGIRASLRKLRGDEDEEDVGTGILRELAANVLNLIPFARDGAGMLYGLEARNANTKPVEAAGLLAKELWDATPLSEGAFDPMKALTNANMLAGIWYGYGADQINQSVKGMAAWLDGESGAGPQSLILGPPRN